MLNAIEMILKFVYKEKIKIIDIENNDYYYSCLNLFLVLYNF
jgi:hypothetical protein